MSTKIVFVYLKSFKEYEMLIKCDESYFYSINIDELKYDRINFLPTARNTCNILKKYVRFYKNEYLINHITVLGNTKNVSFTR